MTLKDSVVQAVGVEELYINQVYTYLWRLQGVVIFFVFVINSFCPLCTIVRRTYEIFKYLMIQARFRISLQSSGLMWHAYSNLDHNEYNKPFVSFMDSHI